MKTKTNHMQGTWQAVFTNNQMSYEQTTVCRLGYMQHKDGFYIVISDSTNHGSEEATAKIIAAAPELLQLAYTYIDDLKNVVPKSDARDCRIREIENLISKATESL